MSESPPTTPSNGSLPTLLLHFDVNRTVIFGDATCGTSTEQGIREGLAELFWGRAWTEGTDLRWEWTKDKPSCFPPEAELQDGMELMTYSVYCKRKISEKKARKDAVRDLRLVKDKETREQMEKIAQAAVEAMQLPEEWHDSEHAQGVGLHGTTHMVFPAIFCLVAKLQRAKRPFAILFRTFGSDHEKVEQEWNAFCEMRHPVFSKFLEDIGPLDGSTPGVPDRRYHGGHTLYRDAVGPVVGLNIITNGPEGSLWDAWAKQKPKPDKDTRGGREFFAQQGVTTIDGYAAFRQWMIEFCKGEHTSAIKDDWAWWQFNRESSTAGKLMLLEETIQQIFFDDNVEHDDARIVDCRRPDGTPIPQAQSMNKFITKINPVEAVLDENYFIYQLRRCHGNCGTVLTPAQSEDATVAPPQQKSFVAQIIHLIRSTLMTVLNVGWIPGISRVSALFGSRSR